MPGVHNIRRQEGFFQELVERTFSSFTKTVNIAITHFYLFKNEIMKIIFQKETY